MKKALIIEGDIRDMGDLLAIARAEGKKAFRTNDNIRVLPSLYRDDVGNFVVLVEYDGVGAYRKPGVGERENET